MSVLGVLMVSAITSANSCSLDPKYRLISIAVTPALCLLKTLKAAKTLDFSQVSGLLLGTGSKETKEAIADRIVSMPATISRSTQNSNV